MSSNHSCKVFDLAIIGAGASGLAAALTIKKENPAADVVILEKKERTAKKLAATGNGRCNLSNIACDDTDTVLSFFEENGILLRSEEDGRLYPYCETAHEISELLSIECEAAGVHIELNSEVKKVEADSERGFEGGFLLFVEGKAAELRSLRARRLLIASGGKSYPSLGTTGDGYVMARSLGHTVNPLAPGLTAVKVVPAVYDEESWSYRAEAADASELSGLKGVRVKAAVSLLLGGRELRTEVGEVQFREDSVSGICVMNLSNYIKPQKRNAADGRQLLSFEAYMLRMDLAPDFTTERLADNMKKLALKRGFTLTTLLKTVVKEKLAYAVAARVAMDANMSAEQLTEADIYRIAGVLKDFSFYVRGLAGWKEAQVTCGGVSLAEINEKSMESKLVSGLYFSGEVTDYAGPCGGFNLHYAWLTGIRAGEAIADSLR